MVWVWNLDKMQRISFQESTVECLLLIFIFIFIFCCGLVRVCFFLGCFSWTETVADSSAMAEPRIWSVSLAGSG